VVSTDGTDPEEAEPGVQIEEEQEMDFMTATQIVSDRQASLRADARMVANGRAARVRRTPSLFGRLSRRAPGRRDRQVTQTAPVPTVTVPCT
jgi:hypothetical protein